EADNESVLEDIRQLLPEITSERLLAGVFGYVEHACYCERLLAKLDAAPPPPVVKQEKRDPLIEILTWVRDPEANRLPEDAIVPGGLFGRVRHALPPGMAAQFGG